MRVLHRKAPALNPRKRLGQNPAADERPQLEEDGYRRLDLTPPDAPPEPLAEPDYDSGPYSHLFYPDT